MEDMRETYVESIDRCLQHLDTASLETVADMAFWVVNHPGLYRAEKKPPEEGYDGKLRGIIKVLLEGTNTEGAEAIWAVASQLYRNAKGWA